MNSQIPISEPGQSDSTETIAFFSAGFRPFFWLAGVYAVVPLFAWLWAYLGDGSTPGEFAPTYWHGHEMIFGFVTAAVTGFLLTAVPNWTRTRPYSGWPLILLVMIWLAGRLAMWFGWSISPVFVAVVDLAMVPALAFYVGKRLVAHKLKRNYIVLGVLFVWFLGNLAMHIEAIGLHPDSAELGINMGIYAVIFLVTMISGRVMPGFTANALRRRGFDVDTATPEPVTRFVIFSVLVALLFDLLSQRLGSYEAVSGALLAIAAIALLVRMRTWKTPMVLNDPIVWILHAGHFWLVVGFALLAWARLSDGMESDAALHALTAGAMGTMIMAMMTRAGLGHSGREIKASPAIVLAFYMVIAGALMRVAAALAVEVLPGDSFSYLIGTGGALWAGSFAIFAIVFWPIVTRARA